MQLIQNIPASASTKDTHPSHTHTDTQPVLSSPSVPVPTPPPLMFLLKTQLSSHRGQQMAQTAHSYLLLNVICFIHSAPQMHR